MESNFHSTVMHHARDDDDRDRDRDRRHPRDILNPAGPSPPQHHSAFSLRSPPRSDYHHHHPPPPPPPHLAASRHPGPLSPMHSTFYSNAPPSRHHPELHPARDQQQPTSSYYDPTTDTRRERRISDASAWPNAASKARDSYQYPQSSVESHHPQPSPSTTAQPYYNGTYSSTAPAPYQPPPHPSSPRSHSTRPPLGSATPPTRAMQMASPSLRQTTSPTTSIPNGARNILNPEVSTAKPPMPHHDASSVVASTPSRTAAQLMSFSNILSNSEPAPEPRIISTSTPTIPPPAAAAVSTFESHNRISQLMNPSDVDMDVAKDTDAEVDDGMETETEPQQEDAIPPLAPPPPTALQQQSEIAKPKAKPRERKDKSKEAPLSSSVPKTDDALAKKEKAPRKPAKSRTSTPVSTPVAPKATSTGALARRGATKKETSPRAGQKRQANGQPKTKSAASVDAKEKKVLAALAQMEADPAHFDAGDSEAEEILFQERATKRRKTMCDVEREQNVARRRAFVDLLVKKLGSHANLGKRRFEGRHYEDALQEVREQELFAEKERKKDMQRKRRREKSMANTIEQKEAALAKAMAAEDDTERQKHLREAERAGKRARHTKLILQKDIKGAVKVPLSDVEDNDDSSTIMASLEPGKSGSSNSKSKRSGNRPKKSKEQKQAEKDNAEAAQAALDAGEDLPTKDETRLRIKISKKSKSKGGGGDAADNSNGSPDGGDDAASVKDAKENVKPGSGAAGSANKTASKASRKSKGAKELKEQLLKDSGKDTSDETDDKELGGTDGTNADGGGGGGGGKKNKIAKAEEPPAPDAKFHTKGFNQIYDQIWRDLARKDVSKSYKIAVDSYVVKASNLKKTAILASKEARRWQLKTNKGAKDQQARAKRVMRDMMGFWKRNEREERDLRKAAEKQELENARKEEADREAARQKRKLNFLISQTELYSHFIGKKIKTQEVERSTDNPEVASAAPNAPTTENGGMDIIDDDDDPTSSSGGPLAPKVTNFEDLDFDAEDDETLKRAAMANAQNAIAEAQKKARQFNNQDGEKAGVDMDDEGELNFQNPTGIGNVDIEQPELLNCQLKEYQLKGLNWLVNLYEQGINGILADEMGLGKTVQSISVMAYLAQKYDVWGPFLVVAPASTLHNWEQEIRKFVPEFKILPYWGSSADRKVLRKFWDRKHSTYKKEASFHVCITSYQLVVSDVSYFQKMKWQYMILDEAQAIKSSQSSRWKCLLSFHCRNRLLLTGTPIQNNMQELWALLHFIMPSLFDSHDEFSEWFSKDIESHAQSNTKLNEDQLKRLHMILKPFMLRRVKKHVQKELGDKIELDIFCDLTYRQRAYYANLRNQISIMDLIEKATLGDDNDSGTLMNLVMQFRKVCNHPDLFERRDTTSPMSFGYFAETASFIREGSNVDVGYSTRSLIEYCLPKLVWEEGGRLYRAGNDNVRAGWRNKALQHMMNIWTPDNIQTSCAKASSSSSSSAFSWLRFADVSVAEVSRASRQDVFANAVDEIQKGPNRLGLMNVAYDDEAEEDRNYTPAHALFSIQARQDRQPLVDITEQGILGSLMNVARAQYQESGLGRLEQAGRPIVTAPPIEVVCNNQASHVERENLIFNPGMRKVLSGPNEEEELALVTQNVPLAMFPPRQMLPAPDNEKKKFNNIAVPSMQRFVTDSGKLAKLDELLFKLKNEGHRVLLYFQMTRMIDLMEEYLTYRNYKYCRLDGSTKLEDRRDTVADFQSRPEIFIFLLSTRAGGLGINLTTADTVIFYDSDWNPTIDSQAMDRAHRLGQTKQVTVYRLITKGTIEERIRKRALQKEEVQRVVIQGGGASVDFSGRRAPENRNRDIAMWLADDEQAEMIERREKELLESGEYDKIPKKKAASKRKRTTAATAAMDEASLDDMYHEGEGHFDDNKASGTATPAAEPDAPAAAKGGKKGRSKPGGKKAKTAKQRLAMADGEVD